VPASAITATSYENDDIFERVTDKSYRESWGYKTPKTVRYQGPEALPPDAKTGTSKDDTTN
jgi:hypothetical protein